MNKTKQLGALVLGCMLAGCDAQEKSAHADHVATQSTHEAGDKSVEEVQQELEQVAQEVQQDVKQVLQEVKQTIDTKKEPTMSSLPVTELKIETLTAPSADAARPTKGKKVIVHYTGWLYDNGTKGKKFDSSLDRGEPFEFPVGMGYVIQGWDQGVLKMQKGGKYMLTIPSHMGYGTRGAGALIPPNATLMFEIELIDFV